MTRRFICLLLVPLLLANQGLAVAHSHYAADIVEPEGHGLRPHFHVGGHDHHNSAHAHEHVAAHSHSHHSDGDRESDQPDEALPPAIVPLADHDVDAMYFAGAVTLARGAATPSVVPAKFIALAAILDVAESSNDTLLRLGPIRGQLPSVLDAACPIYLRTLSLRI